MTLPTLIPTTATALPAPIPGVASSAPSRPTDRAQALVGPAHFDGPRSV